MIRLGLCLPVESLNLPEITALQQMGYDYLETSLTAVSSLSEDAFSELRAVLDKAPIPLSACNGMLPGTLRLTGPDACPQSAIDYLAAAIPRAEALGVQVIVFGSGGARNVPEGFSHEAAYGQLAAFLQQASSLLPGHMQICIEPLRPAECNIIHQVSDAIALLRLADYPPNIRVLGDFYHMAEQNESMDNLRMAGAHLQHTHIAHPGDRCYPQASDGDCYQAFFTALKDIHYSGRISIEGHTDHMLADAPRAFLLLDSLRHQ